MKQENRYLLVVLLRILLKMWKIFIVMIISVTLVSASCPIDCQCPTEVPVCAAGVSLVLDRCGCCKVCAQQLFEDCSKKQPCDAAKGLECNFGGGFGFDKGVCRAKSDERTCEFNSRIYQNGETFQPNCRHQCTCINSFVGCVSLCPRELSLSKLGCTKPKKVKVLRRCCEQFICPDDAKTKRSMKGKHKNKTSKEDLIMNELKAAWREFKSVPALRSQPKLAREFQCLPQTTAWSSCSKSCGSGLSTRVTNNNIQCKLVTETQICETQPCKQINSKKAQKCNHTGKVTQPVQLSYAGCRSLKKFQLKHCGSCSDGRCCRSHRTHTPSVHFRCRKGQTLRRKVTMVESCRCDFKCSSNGKIMPYFHRVFNDIH